MSLAEFPDFPGILKIQHQNGTSWILLNVMYLKSIIWNFREPMLYFTSK